MKNTTLSSTVFLVAMMFVSFTLGTMSRKGGADGHSAPPDSDGGKAAYGLIVSLKKELGKTGDFTSDFILNPAVTDEQMEDELIRRMSESIRIASDSSLHPAYVEVAGDRPEFAKFWDDAVQEWNK